MFEHFGVFDVLYKIKKNILWIILGTLIATSFFSWLNFNKFKAILYNEIKEDYSKIYISTQSYYVQPNINIDSLNTIDYEYIKSLPEDYICLLNTDYCAQYIFDNITAEYSKQDILSSSHINKQNPNLTTNDLNIEHIKSMYCAKRYNSSMMINISTRCYDKNICTKLIEIIQDFLNDNISDKIKHSSLKYSGETQKLVYTSSLSDDGFTIDDKKKLDDSSKKQGRMKSLISLSIKSILIPTIGIISIILIFIIIWTFFHQTLNRKSDFFEYDIPIIGEIKNYSKIKDAD